MPLYPSTPVLHGVFALCTLTSTTTLAQSYGDIETIEVRGRQTGEMIRQEQALTPGGVTVLDGADLYEKNVSSLADMLRYVPGVWSVSATGNDSIFFSSRGSNLDATNYDMNGIKLLQDGLPVTTADGNNHNRIIDPLAARYASMARGANALKYGASTLGGAIDFVTPTARNTDPVQLYLNTGSFGQRIARVTVGAEFSDTLDGLVTIEGKERNGYRAHSQSDRAGVYANLGWRINESLETRFFGTQLNSHEELAGPLTAAQFAEDPNQADATSQSTGGHRQVNVETRRLANKTTWTINNASSLEFGFSIEDQTLFHPIVDKVLVDFDGPGPLQPQEVFSLLIDTDHQDKGLMARYTLEAGEHNLLAGFNWGKNKVTGGNYRNNSGRQNGLTTLVDNNAQSLEAFVMDRWSVSDDLTLIYGLQAVSAERHVRNTTVSNGSLRNPSADYNHVNPRAGVIYQLTGDVNVFANASQLYEAPTNFELEDDLRANNATLNAMNGAVFEVGTRGIQSLSANSFWQWDVSAYYARINNEILSRDDPSAPGTSLTVNIDETVHAGIEALLSGSIALRAGSIEPLVSLTINDFNFEDDVNYGNNSLPAASDYVIHGEIMYRHANGFYAGPTFDFVDERFADFANTYTIDSYSLVGLRTGYNSDTWQVFAELRNLTDREYVAVHSVVNIANANSSILYAGEPLSAYAGLQVHF